MFDGRAILALIEHVRSGAPARAWESTLEDRDLKPIFPALGIDRGPGLRLLRAVTDPAVGSTLVGEARVAGE